MSLGGSRVLDRTKRLTIRGLMMAIAGLALVCEVVRENGIGPVVVGAGELASIWAARRLGRMTWSRAAWLMFALYPWTALLTAVGLEGGVMLLKMHRPEVVASTSQALWFSMPLAFLLAVGCAGIEAHRELGRVGSGVWVVVSRTIALPLVSWSIAWLLLVGYVLPSLRSH